MHPCQPTRRPGRPATYVFDKPDSQLSENELRLKNSIVKRRLRQNRSYHRRKERERAKREQEKLDKQKREQERIEQERIEHQKLELQKAEAQKLNSPVVKSEGTGCAFGSPKLGTSLDLMNHPYIPNENTSSGEFDISEICSSPSVVTASRGQMNLGHSVGAGATPVMLRNSSTMSLSLPSLIGNGDTTVQEDCEDEEEVINATLALSASSKNPSSLATSITDQAELMRMTGLKKIVFDNLRQKFVRLPSTVKRVLRYFAVFPRTFDLKAATAVAGLSDNRGMEEIAKSAINQLAEGNFVVSVGQRYELNDVAKLFLSEDASVAGAADAERIMAEAKDRYVKYYTDIMRRVSEDDIHRIGWVRERAMALYDVERDNMEYSQFLSACMSDDKLRHFLTAGISVMRYCVGAKNRIQLIRDALAKDESSVDVGAYLTTTENAGSLSSSTETTSERLPVTQDAKSKARLELALGEAYCDILDLEEAEGPLLRAMALMGGGHINPTDDPASVADSVLVLLLLANIRMRAQRIQEARGLLVRALKVLKHSGLGKSTFAINAMSNLVGIYVEKNELEKAKSLAMQLLDCLTEMHYDNMPIMADARGQTGLVLLSLGDYKEAEDQFAAALEIVASWESKTWLDIPVQHCLELDLWLMEGWARCMYMQGRRPEAEDMMEKAHQSRFTKGLRFNSSVGILVEQTPSEQWSPNERTHVRHIY